MHEFTNNINNLIPEDRVSEKTRTLVSSVSGDYLLL